MGQGHGAAHATRTAPAADGGDAVKSRHWTIVLIALSVLAGRADAQVLPVVAEDAALTTAAADEPLLTPKLLLRRIAADQKPIWMFPVHAVEGRNWKPTLALIGTTAGLI